LAGTWAIGAVVAQQLYTLWVGGSNPSSPTNFPGKIRRGTPVDAQFIHGERQRHPMKHLKVVLIVVACVTSFACAFAQAEKIKGKAKDLKKNIEAGQTNGAGKTNAPAKK
jgi:hypothetical protein